MINAHVSSLLMSQDKNPVFHHVVSMLQLSALCYVTPTVTAYAPTVCL